jgi:dTMP kinase|tara:strand:- start:2121 stop:2744 length:624 start_codon:yes stop_codon:yes gene_type:complete
VSGKLITFEGGDGAGKTTQVALLRATLRAKGVNVLVTREPGGTEIGERIRDLILHDPVTLVTDAELLLIFAARAQHIVEVIRPALARDKWVLCDRFTDATFAYQGGGRGVPAERVTQLESIVHHGLQPDLTLLLDLPVNEGMARSVARGRGEDRFESQDVAFKERIRAAYLARLASAAHRIRLVDASAQIEVVQAQIKKLVLQVLEP